MSFNPNISLNRNPNELSQWLSSFLDEAQEKGPHQNEQPLSSQSSTPDPRASFKRTRINENTPNAFSTSQPQTYYPPEASSSTPSLDLLPEAASLKSGSSPAFLHSEQPSPKRRRIELVSSEELQPKTALAPQTFVALPSIYSLVPSLKPQPLSMASMPQPAPFTNSLASALPSSRPFTQEQETVADIFSQVQPPKDFYPSKSSSGSSSMGPSLPQTSSSKISPSSPLTYFENPEKLEENLQGIELASTYSRRNFFEMKNEELKAAYAEKIHYNFLKKVNRYSYHFLPDKSNSISDQKMIDRDSTKQTLHPKYMPFMETLRPKKIDFEIEVNDEFDAKNPDSLKRLAYIISHSPAKIEPHEILTLEELTGHTKIKSFKKDGNIVRGTLEFKIKGSGYYTAKNGLFYSFYFGGHCFLERAVLLSNIFSWSSHLPKTYQGMNKALVSYIEGSRTMSELWEKRKYIPPVYFPPMGK